MNCNLKECCYVSLRIAFIAPILCQFIHYFCSNRPNEQYQRATNGLSPKCRPKFTMCFRNTSQDSTVSFGFVANPSAVRQTRHDCSANEMAETICTAKGRGAVKPNSIQPYYTVTFFFKSRERSHRQPNPSRRHTASQRRTPQDLNVRYTAERTSPVTRSNQWPVSRHIIMSPAAHCSRGGAS